jgi:hypothetical protein
MARDDKPLELRPVDDEVVETTPVIRLDNPETEKRERELKPVRLVTHAAEDDESRRLALPAKEQVELRTHQPGIDSLIDSELLNPDVLEQNWGESSSRRNPIPWGWFALIGLVIAGSVLWSISHVGKSDEQAEQFRAETRIERVDDQKEDLEAGLLIDRIHAVVREVFNATSVDALAAIIRHPERVTPLMRNYYQSHPMSSVGLQAVKSLQPLTIDRHGNFWIATVLQDDRKSRSLIIEVLESGEPRIDWETLVCHQPMKWDDYVSRRPAGTSLDFRVYVDEPDNFYSHEFANSDQWMSFRLTALESEETLFGYARTDSPEAAMLRQLMDQNGGRRITLILRLMIPEGLNSRRGVVIEKIVNPRWLYVESPAADS